MGQDIGAVKLAVLTNGGSSEFTLSVATCTRGSISTAMRPPTRAIARSAQGKFGCQLVPRGLMPDSSRRANPRRFMGAGIAG